MPAAVRWAALRPQPTGDRRTEAGDPDPDRLVADGDAALGQQLLDVAQAEREPGIEPDGVLDDESGKAKPATADRAHADALRAASPPNLTSPFAVSLIVAHVACGHLPDRLGGARVALVCALAEVAGLAMIGLAPGRVLAAVGAALAGFGYSLVYRGLGVEAVRRAPPESRGLAMGAFTACLDLALGIASPALGLIAGGAGLGTVLLASTLVVLGTAAVAMRLLRVPAPAG